MSRPKKHLKEPLRAWLLLQDLQPNLHLLTSLQFPEEVKSSSGYVFPTFEKDQKDSKLQRLLFKTNLSENSVKAADTSLKIEIWKMLLVNEIEKSLQGKSYSGSTY